MMVVIGEGAVPREKEYVSLCFAVNVKGVGELEKVRI